MKTGISSKCISKNEGKITKENLRNGTIYKTALIAPKMAMRTRNRVIFVYDLLVLWSKKILINAKSQTRKEIAKIIA